MSSIVAEYFIAKAQKEEQDLTLLRLMKLVYIAHGWNLALFGKKLVSEEVEAWKYGPVYPLLFHKFKKYETDEVGAKSINVRTLVGASVEELSVIRPEHRELLNKVYVKYDGISDDEIVEELHRPGTPWDLVWDNARGRDCPIDDKLTQDYYRERIKAEEYQEFPETTTVKTPEDARKYLVRMGILDDEGNVNPLYRNAQ